jgi:cell division protein FtsW
MGREKDRKSGTLTEDSNPVDIRQKDSARKALKTLLLSVLFLTAIGWVMLLDAGVIYKGVYNPEYFHSLVDKRIIAMVCGIFLIWLAWIIHPAAIRKFSWPMIFLAVIFLVLIFTPLGVYERGSRRWLNLGIVFQPLEFVKLALVWFLADRFARIGQLSKAILMKYVIPGIFVLVCIALVGAQPNLSGVFFLMILTLVMAVLGGINMKPVIALIGAGAIGFAGLLALNSDRFERFLAYNPLANLSDSGYQLSQSLWAVSNGGLLGRGPGGSIAMYSLPDHTTDFVYSIVAEEWGFIGGLAIIILFGLIVYTGFKIALAQSDPFRLLLGCGVSSIIGIQSAVNIGVVLGLLPTTGVPLPFLSAGSSNLILSLGAIGIFANLYKTAGEKVEIKSEKAKPESESVQKKPGYKIWPGLAMDNSRPPRKVKSTKKSVKVKSKQAEKSRSKKQKSRVRRTGT